MVAKPERSSGCRRGRPTPDLTRTLYIEARPDNELHGSTDFSQSMQRGLRSPEFFTGRAIKRNP